MAHSSGAKGRNLSSESLVLKFKHLDLKSFTPDNVTPRWILVGLNENGKIPSSIKLQPFPVEAIKQNMGVDTVELVNRPLDRERSQVCSEHWRFIGENVLQDVLASFEAVRNRMKGLTSKEAKPGLVIRLGSVFFGNRELADADEI